MKKLTILFFLFLVLEPVINAQDYKKFKVGLGAGFTLGNAGFFITFEPAYRIKDNLSIGLRLEGVSLADDIGLFSDPKTAIIYSYSLNGQYYFGSGHKFRPFAGAGFGVYNELYPSSETKLGFIPDWDLTMGILTLHWTSTSLRLHL